MSFKIQMMDGNSLNTCPDSRSQKKLPLVRSILGISYKQNLAIQCILLLIKKI